MKKLNIKTLILDDNDLECSAKTITLSDLSLSHVSFKIDDLKDYELIIYFGKKGTKILKSNYFRTGKIKN